jgi:hypothetical protein
MLARMQAVEIRDAVDAEQHSLAIDDERARSIAQRRFDDQRIAVGPVVPVEGEQPHALALALDDQPVAVVLDLVDPVRTGRDRRSAGRDAGLEESFGHAN